MCHLSCDYECRLFVPVEKGTDVVSRFVDYHNMEPEQEKEYIRRQIRSLKDTTGKTPSGWHYGRLSPKSKGLLHQVLRDENIDLLYQSDCYNDDLPYWANVPAEAKMEDKNKKGMLMMPSR